MNIIIIDNRELVVSTISYVSFSKEKSNLVDNPRDCVQVAMTNGHTIRFWDEEAKEFTKQWRKYAWSGGE